MYCQNCGKKNDEGTKFCCYCGAALKLEKKLNYYEILEITPDASIEVIKAAYKALIKKTHPDNLGTEADGIIKEINAAYEVLSDPDKRQQYNFELYANQETEQSTDVNSDSEENDETSFGNLIGGSIGTAVVFGLMKYFNFNLWVLAISGFLFAILFGSFIGKIVISNVEKRCKESGKMKWGKDDSEIIQNVIVLLFGQMIFWYLGVENWITRFYMIILLIYVGLLVKSIVKILF